MSYEPRGHVKTIIDAMAAQAADLEWSSEELAEIAGIDRKALPSTLKTALRNQALYSERRGRATVYSLSEFEEEPGEVVPFNAAIYLDGDLVIQGVTVNEDGSVTISKEQLAQLKQLITWSAPA